MNRHPLEDIGIENLPWLEECYQEKTKGWQPLFTSLDAFTPSAAPSTKPSQESPKPLSPTLTPSYTSTATQGKDFSLLIDAYRRYGHLAAQTNPIATEELKPIPELDLAQYGLTAEEVEKAVPALHETYCRKIGFEFKHVDNPELVDWLQNKIETAHSRPTFSIDQKRMILQHLNRSEIFESFLHTKFVGQKRFSLEGTETLIPMLALLIEAESRMGVDEIVIGMAHRGRLNVLANILQKSYSDIFSEFEEGYIAGVEGGGDVKYHKGYSSILKTDLNTEMKISITANPSHLESVYPVVEGQVRAKQVMAKDESMDHIIPVVIHGDASLAGQGVVYETLQFYKLPGYRVGGTIHFVINNQIGFTTLPKDARSTRYCTDIARAFSAPVFHVNAEDPEGCVYATLLAAEIRQKFHCDVFVELNGYRKYGHNEGDEPAFTQPLEYQLIREKKLIRELYRDELIHQGVLEKFMAESLEEEFKTALNKALKANKPDSHPIAAVAGNNGKDKATKERIEQEIFTPVETAEPLSVLKNIMARITTVPEGFTLNKKLEKLLKDQQAMLETKTPTIDWGMGETLALGSLLVEGNDVRLSGQDSRRGTFSHRHGMWVDQKNARKYFPLNHLTKDQGRFDLYNSSLSEYAALGFEFGYSLANPNSLVLWEAQFGDFANGAQIIIDQYIATAEQKWGSQLKLVLLLPHGYEGQGPEHSSGRIERFLSLAGFYNMQVCVPSTPAQLFHLLRRQAKRNLKKPLIIFTPKSLLRNPLCVSAPKDLTSGTFQEIIDDPRPGPGVKRILFCMGKIYYELVEARERLQVNDMAIVRVEQLYPLHLTRLKQILEKYPSTADLFWVQEEPSNMGAWKFIKHYFDEVTGKERAAIQYIGRPPNASPATGSFARHKKESTDLMNAVFKSEAQPFYELSYQTRPA